MIEKQAEKARKEFREWKKASGKKLSEEEEMEEEFDKFKEEMERRYGCLKYRMGYWRIPQWTPKRQIESFAYMRYRNNIY